MRIEKLQKKYSENNVAKGEIISSRLRAEINKRNRTNQNIRLADTVLRLVREDIRLKIKDEVYFFITNYRLKDFCRRCKLEGILAILCLYVWRHYNPRLKEEETKLWATYKLDWKTYARVIGGLCRTLRKDGYLK